jgi:hypothetical protein
VWVSLALGCGQIREASDMRALKQAQARFSVPAPCAPTAAQGAVERSGADMELSVESESSAPGEPWVLSRGKRLADPELLYRVDVTAVKGNPNASRITIWALARPLNITDTQETVAKPGELAMRIVAACTQTRAP